MDIKQGVLWFVLVFSSITLWNKWEMYNGKPSMFAVQLCVHDLCSDRFSPDDLPVRKRPGVPEGQEPAPAAFSARPMTCRQSRGFIEEEEFGVSVRGHHHPMLPLEFEHAKEHWSAR